MKKIFFFTSILRLKAGCCFVILILAIPAAAQNQIKGMVREASTQPAAYATIAVVSPKDSAVVKGGLTDDTGNFILAGLASGEYILTVQYLGHKIKWLPVVSLSETSSSMDLGEILLESKTENLSELTVTGQRSLVENLGDKMVLNVANSVIAKGNKVDDLLKYAPMISMSPTGIKVGNKDNVLILIDGRQTSQGSLDNFLKSFSAEQILKIEVISNPSAKYDASYGAVVNIVTKKSLERGLNGRAGFIFSQGSYARSNPDLSLNFRSTRWSIFTTMNGRLNNVGSDEATLRKYQQGFMDGKSFSFYKTYDVSTFSGIDYFAGTNHTLGFRFNSGWQKNDTKTDGTTYFKSFPARTDSVLFLRRTESDRTGNYDANFNYTVKLDGKGKEISVNLTKSFFDRSNNQILNYRYVDAELIDLRQPQNLRIGNPKDEQNLVAKTDLSMPVKMEAGNMDFSLRGFPTITG